MHSGITAARTVSYTYDDEGRIIETNDTAHGSGGGITTNTYNDEDQLVRIASPEGIINYAYDDLGQLVRTWTGDTASSLNGGTPTTENVYTYDTLGRLSTVTQTWRQATDITDETTSYTYDLNGNLATQVTQWNDVVSDYDYDEMNRLTHLTHFVDSNGDRILDDMSEQTLAMFNYSYLADGTRSQAVETDDLGDVTTITWEYDGLNRLVSETSESTNDDRDYTDAFTYDLSSNRLTQTHTTLSDVVTTVYFYDANDRLLAEVKDSTADDTQDTFTEYAYDNTNQTGKTVFAGTDNTGNITSSVTYTYDASGRMVMVQTDSDGDGSINSTVTYTYDTSSHRVTETTNDPGSGTTTTRSFLFDPQNATGYGKQIEEHVDGQLSKTFIIGHMIIAQHDATNGLLNFIQDGHGNTRALVNAAATIIQRFTFDAYGKTLTAENYTLADNALTMWLNPDGAYSVATGLTNHIERWRSGARFLSLDSYSGNASDPISLHKYLYAHANPIMGIDPSGQMTLIEIAIVAGKKGGMFAKKVVTSKLAKDAAMEGLLNVLIGAGIRGIFNSSKEAFNPNDMFADFAGGFVGGLTSGLLGRTGLAKKIGRRISSQFVSKLVVIGARFGPEVIGAMFGTAVEIYAESRLTGQPIDKQKALARIGVSGLLGVVFKASEVSVEQLGSKLTKYASDLDVVAQAEVQRWVKNMNKNWRKGKYGLVDRASDAMRAAEQVMSVGALTKILGDFLRGAEMPGAIQLSGIISDAISEETINKI